jgi:hypothetical protein
MGHHTEVAYSWESDFDTEGAEAEEGTEGLNASAIQLRSTAG